ncbi:uncharacterized protein MELLADRAFT_95471 [Melampsora larici-populina 98AG31]|uniref:Secreted protein n=1 Tax=Melampsora larici-populina (strain 98AG31 / pathotype 3-4-7) TaxID=747676 RepID=F4S9G4_MELLP|nr:uncharacterized protein MELLADRAFT_95471 [Melampsora larici-populina 98AG31]EGF98734.1 hypothetical protein MELLADRAFT_95471 [Melampsora larici-populina 98AG31]
MRSAPIWMLVTASIYGNVLTALSNEPELVSASEHLLTSLPDSSDPLSAYTSAEETSSLVPHQTSDINESPSDGKHTPMPSHSEPYTLLPIYQVGRPVLQLLPHPEPETLLPIYQLPAPVLNPSTPNDISATFHPASSPVIPPNHIIPWHHVFEPPIIEDWSRHLHLPPQLNSPHHNPPHPHNPPHSDIPAHPHIPPYARISPYPYNPPYPHISPYPRSPYPHSPYPYMLHRPGTSSGAIHPIHTFPAPQISPFGHSNPRIENTYTNIFHDSPFTSSLSHHTLNPEAPSFRPTSDSAMRRTKGTGFFHTELQRFDDDFRMKTRQKDVFPNDSPESSMPASSSSKFEILPTSIQKKKLKKKLKKLRKKLEFLNEISESSMPPPSSSKPKTSLTLSQQKYLRRKSNKAKKLLESTPIEGSKQKTSRKVSWKHLKWMKEREKSDLAPNHSFSRARSGETERSSAKEILIGQHRVNIDSPRANNPTTSWHLAAAHSQGLEEPTISPHADQLSPHSISSEASFHRSDPEVNREPEEAQTSSSKLQDRPSVNEHTPVLDVKTPTLFAGPEDNTGPKPHVSPAGKESLEEHTTGLHEDQLSHDLVSSRASSRREDAESERDPRATQATSSELQDQPPVLENAPFLDVKDLKLFPALKDNIDSDNRVTAPLSLYKHLSPSFSSSEGKKISAEAPSSSNSVTNARNPDKLKTPAKSLTPATPVVREFKKRPKKLESVRSVITTNEDKRADMEATFKRAQLERSPRLEDSRGQSSISQAPLYSSLKTSLDSSSRPGHSGADSLLESGVSNLEKLKSGTSNPDNDRIPQRRVNMLSKLELPEDDFKSQKKASKALLEDLDFADPNLLNQNKKVAPKSKPSKTRASTVAKGKDVKIDPQTSTSIDSTTAGQNFWSNVAPMISHLRANTPSGNLPFLPSSTSQFLGLLKSLNPLKWMGKYEPDPNGVKMSTEEIKYIEESQHEKVHDSTGAILDSESSSALPTSTRVQTHPSRRKRKKKVSLPASATSADVNTAENFKELSDNPALEAITRSLQVDDDRPATTLIGKIFRSGPKCIQKPQKKNISGGCNLLHQLKHYDIRARYTKVKPRLDSVTINRWNNLFRIEELCPALSHIHKSDDLKVQLSLGVTTLSESEKEVLTEVLGVSEFKKRVDLINYMRQRDSVGRWWSEDELQDARWQGLNVLDLLLIGDLLHFGMPHEDGFEPFGPRITLIHMYGKMLTRKNYPEVYPIRAKSWGESPEREWFHQHPTLWSTYQARMKSLILSSDFELLGDSAILRGLGRPPVSPWWSLGDFLMWNDEGVHLGQMAEVADRVGKQLGLTHFRRLTPRDLEVGIVKWKKIFRDMDLDSDTKVKAKICLEKRARWNVEPRGLGSSFLSYLLNKVTGNI